MESPTKRKSLEEVASTPINSPSTKRSRTSPASCDEKMQISYAVADQINHGSNESSGSGSWSKSPTLDTVEEIVYTQLHSGDSRQKSNSIDAAPRAEIPNGVNSDDANDLSNNGQAQIRQRISRARSDNTVKRSQMSQPSKDTRHTMPCPSSEAVLVSDVTLQDVTLMPAAEGGDDYIVKNSMPAAESDDRYSLKNLALATSCVLILSVLLYFSYRLLGIQHA